MKRLLSVMAVAVLAAAAAVIPIGPSGAGIPDPPPADGPTATVYVLHGIPSLPVDVCVSNATGAPLIPDFQPGSVAGPLEIPSGQYLIRLVTTGTNCALADSLYKEVVTVPAGSSTIVVWAPDNPDLEVFPNDVACTAPGTGRITARHAASAAGPVNVLANGTVVVPGLAPGTQADLDVPVGEYAVEVQLVEGGTTILGPTTVSVTEGTNLTLTVVNALEKDVRASVVPLALTTGVCSAPVELQPAFTG